MLRAATSYEFVFFVAKQNNEQTKNRMRCCPLKWTFCFLHAANRPERENRDLLQRSCFSRSGESSAKTTKETAQEISSAKKKKKGGWMDDISNGSREVTRGSMCMFSEPPRGGTGFSY